MTFRTSFNVYSTMDDKSLFIFYYLRIDFKNKKINKNNINFNNIFLNIAKNSMEWIDTRAKQLWSLNIHSFNETFHIEKSP